MGDDEVDAVVRLAVVGLQIRMPRDVRGASARIDVTSDPKDLFAAFSLESWSEAQGLTAYSRHIRRMPAIKRDSASMTVQIAAMYMKLRHIAICRCEKEPFKYGLFREEPYMVEVSRTGHTGREVALLPRVALQSWDTCQTRRSTPCFATSSHRRM